MSGYKCRTCDELIDVPDGFDWEKVRCHTCGDNIAFVEENASLEISSGRYENMGVTASCGSRTTSCCSLVQDDTVVAPVESDMLSNERACGTTPIEIEDSRSDEIISDDTQIDNPALVPMSKSKPFYCRDRVDVKKVILIAVVTAALTSSIFWGCVAIFMN